MVYAIHLPAEINHCNRLMTVQWNSEHSDELTTSQMNLKTRSDPAV